MTDADYADDLAFMANATAQAKVQVWILEQAVEGIWM